MEEHLWSVATLFLHVVWCLQQQRFDIRLWLERATVTGCLIWGGFLGHLWSTTCEVFYTWHWAFYLAIRGFWGEQSLCRISQLNFLYEIILRCMNVYISHICSVILHSMPSSVLHSYITFHIVICQ